MNAAELVEYLEKFWACVDRSDPEGCWPWTGETNNQNYGRLACWENGRRTRVFAHRLAVLLSGVALAPEQKVLHRCDNPPCCNPAHLRVGTQRDNVHDAIERRRIDLSGLAIGQRISTVYRGEPAACGTESGATRHRRRSEPVCEACRGAVRTANAHRRQRRRLKSEGRAA